MSALVGRSHLADPIGDLRDATGEIAAQPNLAMDLVEVRLAAGSGLMRVEFVAAGPIPRNSGPGEILDGFEQLVWRVEFYDPDAPRGPYSEYLLRASLLGSEWEVDVLNPRDGTNVLVSDSVPTIDGNTLSISAPLSMFPSLPIPFQWTALTYWDNRVPPSGLVTAGRDDVPDEGRARPAFEHTGSSRAGH